MRKSPLERMEKALQILDEESLKLMTNRSNPNQALGAWINWNTSNIAVSLLMMRSGIHNFPELKDKLGLSERDK